MAEEQAVVREEGGGGERVDAMKPWEQHSAVISIPRYDYNAPSSLLHHSHSGFLVTCPIKREKSATKEAISILEKYIGLLGGCSSEGFESTDTDAASKRRKTCIAEVDGECQNGIENNSATKDAVDSGEPRDDSGSSSVKSDKNLENIRTLSLVKLTRSGLLLFTFPRNNSSDVVRIVSTIYHALESGSLSLPLWCNRIFPVQATCSLNEKELRGVVSKLVIQFVNNEQNKSSQPIKFAVGYNRRGIEETEMKMKVLKNTSSDSEELALLDRNKCFAVVAAAVKEVVSDAVVDLASPEFSVLVELLPLYGLPNGRLMVAVSVLPRDLVTTKPRLCVKALASDIKTSNGKKGR